MEFGVVGGGAKEGGAFTMTSTEGGVEGDGEEKLAEGRVKKVDVSP